jgi:hypothetical protein
MGPHFIIINEVAPRSFNRVLNTAFCKKNGIQSYRNHKKFHYFYISGDPRCLRGLICAVELYLCLYERLKEV